LQNKLRRAVSFILFFAALVILSLAVNGSRLYTDWLWFQSMNYQHVFMTILLSEIGLSVAVGLILFVVLFINLMLTRGPLLKATQAASVLKEDDVLTIQHLPLSQIISPKFITVVFALLSLLMAVLFYFSVANDWVTLQKFLHPTSFGISDPIFNKDIGFYVFKLPFYLFLYRVASLTIIVTAFWVTMVYLVANLASGNPGRLLQSISARYHLSFLAALFFIIRAMGYLLEQYNLLFTHYGAVWGAGYTSIHATLIAYKVLVFIALLCAVAILVNLFLRRFRLVVYSIGVLLVTSVLLGGMYPAAVQKFMVSPNEAAIEKPYLERNIQFTRLAYNLNKIERKDFPAGRILSADDNRANQDTIRNIRLWDWEPLIQTYAQLQEMRLYYDFNDIDVDRYIVDGRYRQVMLAAREINQESLLPQAKTWVNQKLTYTHGYGVAMSPVNEFTGEGLPTFFLKDIPPTGPTNIQVTRPEIYYGELTDQYVIVNTNQQEFDYPQGDVNVFTTYEGESGVPIANFFRRVLFALTLSDYKMLLSGEIDNNSRVLYYRNIKQRVPKIAPFLQYDKDPYVVISDGKLYWMWDAYTTTNKYPYSEPYERDDNYIRNSVKVIIDAYSGHVDFYVSDDEDPIIMTYSKIFPGMFKPLDEMPEDLKQHMRYPEDLFKIQASMYSVYHMEDAQVFYNREDKWNMPTEIFGKEQRPMEPYYTIIKLPESKEPEYVLIIPFTPQQKMNMIAWMAARSDGEEYGKLISYNFPKQEIVYGPMQIEARINQDTTISQQTSLWDQRGSSVIRGNTLVIPVKDSLLYIEPLYLQSEQSKMPELRRVIVVHGEMVVMEPTLELALERIFGPNTGLEPTIELPSDPGQQLPLRNLQELARDANQLYDDALNKMKAGDWAGYGDTLNKLKQTLSELVETAETD